LSTRTITSSISVNASPEEVLAAFTTSTLLEQWWKVERSLIDKEVGGLYLLSWKINQEGFGYVLTGVIEEYIPGQLLEIRRMAYFKPNHPIFGPMSLRIEVKATDPGTTLLLTHEGYQSGAHWNWYFEVVEKAWPVVLQEMKTFVESSS
jgi:uncharacterized protein YndB with AHSA1/START domain